MGLLLLLFGAAAVLVLGSSSKASATPSANTPRPGGPGPGSGIGPCPYDSNLPPTTRVQVEGLIALPPGENKNKTLLFWAGELEKRGYPMTAACLRANIGKHDDTGLVASCDFDSHITLPYRAKAEAALATYNGDQLYQLAGEYSALGYIRTAECLQDRAYALGYNPEGEIPQNDG